MAFPDNLNTPYIVSAIEVEVTGTDGAVLLEDVEYLSTGSIFTWDMQSPFGPARNTGV